MQMVTGEKALVRRIGWMPLCSEWWVRGLQLAMERENLLRKMTSMMRSLQAEVKV